MPTEPEPTPETHRDLETINDPVDWLTKHGDVLFRYALSRIHDRNRAEDLVQETLLAAIGNREQFSGRSAERTWLISILRRKIVDAFRIASRQGSNEYEGSVETLLEESFTRSGHWKTGPALWRSDPVHDLENREFREVLDKCMARLPKGLSNAFVLRELEEMDTESICQVLAISPSNLWARLHRARLLLRRCLEQNWFAQS